MAGKVSEASQPCKAVRRPGARSVATVATLYSRRLSLRRTVLDALSGAVDAGGEDELAFAALAGVDPLLRPLARGRLRRALAEARRLTAVEAAGAARRVAWLVVAGDPPAAPDDPREVKAAFERSRRHEGRLGRRIWWATGLASLMLVTALTGAVVAVLAGA